MSFISSQNKGYRMKFENGFSISVQWGTINYCERQTYNDDIDSSKERIWKSMSAEVAVFDEEDGMLPIGDGDSVIGWLLSDEVAKIINIVSTATNKDQIIKQIKSIKLK